MMFFSFHIVFYIIGQVPGTATHVCDVVFSFFNSNNYLLCSFPLMRKKVQKKKQRDAQGAENGAIQL